ncbi:MAG TPA: hypothetical protein P5254_08555, partial [Aquihabitans sp.]|nr:hypothetical protein [Aquihabitans sp.]
MRPTRALRRTGLAVVALLAAGLAGAGTAPTGAAPLARTEAVTDVVELRPLQTRDRRFVDDLGRDVLLRGANVNSLGEYWQGVPGLGPTFALTAED